ncbi:MAG: hypothetical protein BWY77_01267 [bacterium ADurb.Bin431]|nr:MAG: hypothetical protein BWY77_01267 [bacterium ADurb.Bin431]
MAPGLGRCGRHLQIAHRIASDRNILPPLEEGQGPGEAEMNLIHSARQQPCGDAGIAVLLLNERRIAEEMSHEEHRPAHISTRTDDDIGAHPAQDGGALAQAADQPEGERQIGPEPAAGETAHGEKMQGKTHLRDDPGLDAAARAGEMDLGLRLEFTQLLGDGDGRIKMATSAAAGEKIAGLDPALFILGVHR